jgi:hypothetical protein
MTPQLWVNYRLKSVAALPAKQFVYKLLNTIIDDLFAFVIKMPLLHRLSVFRYVVFALSVCLWSTRFSLLTDPVIPHLRRNLMQG